jgi:diguanylate cyclase (GGDEF)-like protein
VVFIAAGAAALAAALGGPLLLGIAATLAAAAGVAASVWQASQRRAKEQAARDAARTAALVDAVLECTGDAIIVFESDTGRVLRANAAASSMLGVPTAPSSPEQMLEPTAGLATAEPRARGGEPLLLDQVLSLDGGAIWPAITAVPPGQEACLVRHDGASFLVESRVRALGGSVAAGTWALGLRDIRERKSAEKQIWQLAYFDALTGLPNRFQFLETLQLELQQAGEAERGAAVFVVDLDGLHRIKDRYGHGASDKVLRAVGKKLQHCLGKTGVVARDSGSEYLLLITGLDASADLFGYGQELARCFETDVRLGPGVDVKVTASIGGALFPQHGTDPSSLITAADLAMVEAKSRGAGRVAIFDAELKQRSHELADLQRHLEHALSRNEFSLHYQPQADSRTGRLCGLEALLRWTSPVLGSVPPGRFLPIAEQSDFIVRLGEWVLNEACRQVRAWMDEGLHVPRVAVNLSARQLAEPSFVERVGEIVSAHGVDPGSLELEVTESLAVENPEAAREVLVAFKERGFAIALDDFGTGYSSLSYLNIFPFDRVKLDRSFVMNITSSAHDQAMVRGIVALAHSLHLDVVAEGVETSAQASLLRAYGCDTLQGYGLGRPQPAPSIHALLVHRDPLWPGEPAASPRETAETTPSWASR